MVTPALSSRKEGVISPLKSNPMQEFHVTSQFDPPTLKLGSAMHMRYRHPIFVIIRYLYLLMVPLGLGILYFGAGELNRLDRTAGYLLILMGPLLFMRKIFWQYRLIQGAKSSPQAGQNLPWTFDDQGVSQKSKSHESETQWSGFHDRFLSPKGILLYPQKNLYYILPRSAFDSQESFEQVSRLCSEKINPPS